MHFCCDEAFILITCIPAIGYLFAKLRSHVGRRSCCKHDHHPVVPRGLREATLDALVIGVWVVVAALLACAITG